MICLLPPRGRKRGNNGCRRPSFLSLPSFQTDALLSFVALVTEFPQRVVEVPGQDLILPSCTGFLVIASRNCFVTIFESLFDFSLSPSTVVCLRFRFSFYCFFCLVYLVVTEFLLFPFFFLVGVDVFLFLCFFSDVG